MSDQQPPYDEDEISRLLAGARVREPMPEDVVARLDRVLDDLAGERSTAEVVPLARRRRPARVLLAAAAVAVVATGGIVTMDRIQGGVSDSGADTAAAGESAQADRDAAMAATPSARSGLDALKAPTPLAEMQDSAGAYDGRLNSTLSVLPTLSSEHFARDAEDVVGSVTATKAAAGSGAAARTHAPACLPPLARTAQGTRLLAVRLDDRPAWLLVGPPEGTPASSLVTAWSCGGASELARAVVPEK